MTNLAREWVKLTGRTVAAVRADYAGSCIDFAGDFLDAIGRGRLAYFDAIFHPKWRYHAAAEIDGWIHDLWEDEALPIDKYMEAIGATTVEYPAEEKAL